MMKGRDNKMAQQKFLFGDIVVVDGLEIGVVVKSWREERYDLAEVVKSYNYDVYVRRYNRIKNYKEEDIQRYGVRHKYLSDEEVEYQRDYVEG